MIGMRDVLLEAFCFSMGIVYVLFLPGRTGRALFFGALLEEKGERVLHPLVDGLLLQITVTNVIILTITFCKAFDTGWVWLGR